MSIEKITGKIIKEADEQSKAILDDAAEKEKEIISAAEKDAAKIKEDFSAKAEKEAEILVSRRISVAELESRKLTLAAKQDAVSEAFNSTIDALCALSEDKYISFLSECVLETGETSGQVLFNKKDRQSIGQKVIDVANAKGNSFTLSDKLINAKGGLVVKCNAVEFDSTLETIVDHLKEEMTPDVVKALFG